MAFSPEARVFAGAGFEEVRLWDVASGQETAVLREHTDWVYSVAISPDGNVLASGSGDSSIKLWDVSELTGTAPPEPSAPTWDLNDDGKVDIIDLVLVASAFGSSGVDLPAAVNGDANVNIVDLVTVAAHFGESTITAAPGMVAAGHVGQIEEWVRRAHASDDGSETFRRGLGVLGSLLRAAVPHTAALLPNYPNPFNPETWIPYRLREDAEVAITVYDDAGRPVRTLDLGHRSAGIHTTAGRAAHWDGRDNDGELVSSGAYFVEMVAGEYRGRRRVVVMK